MQNTIDYNDKGNNRSANKDGSSITTRVGEKAVCLHDAQRGPSFAGHQNSACNTQSLASRCLPCKGASVQSLRKASQGPQPLAFNPVSSTWVSVIKHRENLLSSYRSWALEHLFTRMLQPTKKIGCDSVPHKQEHLDPRNTDWEVMPRDTKNQGKKISCTLGNINFTHRFWWRKDKQWSNC